MALRKFLTLIILIFVCKISICTDNYFSAVAPVTPIATTVPGNARYKAIGCYNDAANIFITSKPVYYTSTTMTVEYCLSYCAILQGITPYNYAAVQGGKTCLCGMGIDTVFGTLQYDYSHCNKPCTGSYFEFCGGISARSFAKREWLTWTKGMWEVSIMILCMP